VTHTHQTGTGAARRRAGGRVLLAGAVALLLAAVGCSGGSSSSQAVAPAATASGGETTGALAWGACASSAQRGYQCATLQVPLDHGDTSGRSIGIALIRARATDSTRRIGSLLINPGGPGESTVNDFSGYLGQLSSTLRARFDVIGFDPRGVGNSAPVQCLQGPALEQYIGLDAEPQTPAETNTTLTAAQKFVAACTANAGSELPYLSTEQTARDMDDIRAAVGDSQLTYLGFSYGTFLGAQYADLFPTKVRALVLDGALDPTIPTLQSATIQAQGFENVLKAFLADCQAQGRACAFQPGGDLLTGYRGLMEKLRTQPPLPTQLSGRRLLPGEAQLGALTALYSKQTWPVLAQALQQAANGDGTTLLRLADLYTNRRDDGTYDNSTAANVAINCRDYPSPTDPQAYVAAAKAAEQVAPDFAELDVLGGVTCAYWPVHATKQPGPLTAAGAPPIVVVGTTNDPATPYSEAQSLAKQLSSGVLLTRKGDEHTAYGDSTCVQNYADTYLTQLTPPPAGTVCQS
jgi:pimeloyl-ACP methyl ester carboxylesterase